MSLSDSHPRTPPVILFPSQLEKVSPSSAWMGLPGSLLICPHAPSSITPESLTVASTRCFTVSNRLRPNLQLGRFQTLTRPNQVRLPSARAFALQGFAGVDYSLPRLLGYVSNGLFTRQPPSRLLDQPSFPGAQIRSQFRGKRRVGRLVRRQSGR